VKHFGKLGQGCAASALTGGLFQQAVFSFSLCRDRQDVCVCIDILILMYWFCDLIFSVPISEGSDK
jgi:hypothetical protein